MSANAGQTTGVSDLPVLTVVSEGDLVSAIAVIGGVLAAVVVIAIQALMQAN